MSATSGRPEYIERYAILNIVNDAVSNNALSYEGCVNEIIERIAQTQSADVVVRKHGKWIDRDDVHYGWNTWQCSVCGDEFILEEGTPDVNGYNFCPNCGADMRKLSKESES